MFNNTATQQKRIQLQRVQQSQRVVRLQGGMAPLTGEEKHSPCPDRQHLQMAEHVCGVY